MGLVPSFSAQEIQQMICGERFVHTEMIACTAITPE